MIWWIYGFIGLSVVLVIFWLIFGYGRSEALRRIDYILDTALEEKKKGGLE